MPNYKLIFALNLAFICLIIYSFNQKIILHIIPATGIIKKNKTIPLLKKRVLCSEICKSEKDKYHMVLLNCPI